jgi:hypothetical protein
MAIADRVKGVLTPKDQESRVKVPQGIEEKMKRGRARMRDGATQRNECLEFWRGNQYVYRGDDGILVNQNTITLSNGRGKPRHRVRTTRNILLDVVAHEVSAATQRVPAYEVNPTTSDPEDISAARLAGKVAHYGYDKWSVRALTEKVVTYAVVADEGFAWPYWDSTVGPFYTDDDGSVYGQGEISVRVFGGNECYWEPGQKFDESRWHAVEQARTLESVYQLEDYSGPPKLTPDATADEMPSKGRDSQHNQLVLVTEYLERPCPKYPNGRWLTMANGKQILPERTYPCTDEKGNTVDEPVIHKLSYITDPDSDRDSGLVKHLLDAQRTINDCTNKQLEWKNLSLNPQIIVTNGSMKQRITDEPGAVFQFEGIGDIKFREVPAIPAELSQIKEESKGDVARIAAQNDIPGQVESGKGIQALIEKDATRRQAFIANLAEFHSRFMRHCLYLVQKHYTEPRLLKIRGRYGTDTVTDFLGSELRGQADVTVFPGSLEPRSRAAIEQKIIAFADRGWVTPEAAMAAINGGTAENLVQSYEQDVARAHHIIEQLRAGPEVFFGQPERPLLPGEGVDPVTGLPPMDEETGEPITTVPGWMPRPFDNIAVHKLVIEDWLKSQDYDMLPPDLQEAANTYYQQLLSLEQQNAIREAQMQQQMAEGLGMANASKPQKASPSPDQSKPSGEVFSPRYETGATETF